MGNERFQDLSQCVNFLYIVDRKFRHEGAAPRHGGDQPICFEPVESLANRGLADPVATGKEAFGQMLAAIEFAPDDFISDGLVGALSQVLWYSNLKFFSQGG
jgi:hypothetical protein